MNILGFISALFSVGYCERCSRRKVCIQNWRLWCTFCGEFVKPKRSQVAAKRLSQPATQLPISPGTQVKFEREVRKPHSARPNVQTVTKLYSATTKEAAVAFLQN